MSFLDRLTPIELKLIMRFYGSDNSVQIAVETLLQMIFVTDMMFMKKNYQRAIWQLH